MKKVIFIMVLVMSALVINAQTTTKTTKSTETTTTAKSAPTPVKVADLPKPITDNIAKDYAGFTVKDASSVTSNNVTTYHVVVTKGASTETLVYDGSGKFLKKLGSKAPAHKTAKKK
jgi:flagellar basal body-associated protein FliL